VACLLKTYIWGHRELNPDPLVASDCMAIGFFSRGFLALRKGFKSQKRFGFSRGFFACSKKGSLEPAALPGYAMTPLWRLA